MLDRFVPKNVVHLLELIRFNKPIGFMLLMWPCWFALAILPYSQQNLMHLYLFFAAGAFLMRSAGCIINDLIDINLDKKVTRTSTRPLASNTISIFNAIILLLILLFLALLILIQFSLGSIICALLALPLIVIYPFMKRFTYWPQLFLGLVFNWGILIVSIEFYNKINIEYLFLYFSCVMWTIAYDTIYAYQDRNDDIRNNIKSTAILFGDNGRKIVLMFYTLFFIIIAILGYISSGSFISLIIAFAFIFTIVLFLNKWDLHSTTSSNYYFRFNNVVGLCCFLFLIIF